MRYGASLHGFIFAIGMNPLWCPGEVSYAKIAAALRQVMDSSVGYLARCGLNVVSPGYVDNHLVETVFRMLCKRTSEHIRLPLYFRDMRSCPRYSSQCCFRVWRHTPGARRAASCRCRSTSCSTNSVDRQAGRLQALDRVHALFRHAVSGADPVRSAACRHVPAA